MAHRSFTRLRVVYNDDAARMFGKRHEDIPAVVPERILVFSPRPDDETISCGGTVFKNAKMLSSTITSS